MGEREREQVKKGTRQSKLFLVGPTTSIVPKNYWWPDRKPVSHNNKIRIFVLTFTNKEKQQKQHHSLRYSWIDHLAHKQVKQNLLHAVKKNQLQIVIP
jgi:hypothetical protein